MLTGWLDWQRATVAMTCEDVSEADARRTLLPSSPVMTIAGVRLPQAGWRVEGISLARLVDEYDVRCAHRQPATSAIWIPFMNSPTESRVTRSTVNPVLRRGIRWAATVTV